MRFKCTGALTPPGVTMFELHSNYTINGRRALSGDGELPTYHALHETIEITHGFNDWSELGFYWFMSEPDGQGSAVGRNASSSALQHSGELGLAGRPQHLSRDRLCARPFFS